MIKRIFILLIFLTFSQIESLNIYSQPQMYQLDKNGINKNISVDNIFKDSKKLNSDLKNAGSEKFSIIQAEAKINQESQELDQNPFFTNINQTKALKDPQVVSELNEQQKVKKTNPSASHKEKNKTHKLEKKTNKIVQAEPEFIETKQKKVKKLEKKEITKKIQKKKIKPLSKRKYISKKLKKKRIKKRTSLKRNHLRRFSSRKYDNKKVSRQSQIKRNDNLRMVCQVNKTSSLYCKYKKQGKDYMAWIFKPDKKSQYSSNQEQTSCSGTYFEDTVDSTYQQVKSAGSSTAWIFKPLKPYSQYGSNSCERGEAVYANAI